MRLLKSALICLIFFFSSEIAQAQIPNGSFEEWETPNTWTDTPVGWLTQNGQLIQNTVRDSFPNSGNWAMRVYPILNGIGELGYAKTTVALSQAPNALDFYAKWEKTSSAATYLELKFLYDDAIVYTDTWFANVDTSDWTAISIPIDLPNTPVTHMEVSVNVSVGDFAPGEGWLAVDDMSIDYINGAIENAETDIIFSPNPCDNALNINANRVDDYENMVVYDSIGHLIYYGRILPTYDTGNLANGLYIIQFGEGEELIKEKFQVRH